MTMPESQGRGPPYEVHASDVIVKNLRRLQRQAARQGRGEEALTALRHIYQRPHQNPDAAGEALYRLPAIRMQVRTIVVRPLAVDFAVHEDRPLVFIKRVQLLT
jgi:hypothetical protein